MEEQKEVKAEGQAKGVNPLKAVWDFFTSLKLTVVLLIILALVSIIGTVVDQTNPDKNMKMLIDMFGPASAPGVLNFLVKSGLTNMYHSWWFVGLLIMLSANITVCTLERLPRVLHMVFRQQEPITDEALRTIPLKREFKAKGDIEAAKQQVSSAMKACGFSPKQAESGGVFHFFAETGKYSRLGVYITHISVIIIFVGALIGSFWGYKGYVQISEGQSIDKVDLINRPLLRHFGNSVPLDFQVRCDKFVLKMYEGSQMPSDYLSTLTVLDGGKEVDHKTIRVNDPLEYKSIRFFQSSYGVAPGMATLVLRVTPKGGQGQVRDYDLLRDKPVEIQGSDYTMVMAEVAPDVAVGPNNQLIAQSDQFKGHAAAIIKFFDKTGKQVDMSAIVNDAPNSQPEHVPYTFSIMNYRGPYYTGLQVTYDPGVLVVWLGCITMVLGILVAFFTYHKRVWARVVRGDKGQAVVTVAGISNKNRHAFEGEFKKLVDKLGFK